MKNIFKLLLSSLFTLTLISCEEEITILQPKDGGHVQLVTSDAIAMSETSPGVEITIQLGISDNTDGYYADFEVVSDHADRFTYSPADGRAFFSPGTYETKIKVTPNDNLIADGNATLIINLTGSNSGVYGSDELSSVSLTIQDNDCPTETSKTYKGSGTAFGGYVYPEFEVEFQVIDENTYYVETLWGEGFVEWATGSSVYSGLFVYPAFITLNDDFTLTIEGDANAPYGQYYTNLSTGTYSACDDQFTIEIVDSVFRGGAGANVTFTGNND